MLQVVTGKLNKQIAGDLGIAEKTVSVAIAYRERQSGQNAVLRAMSTNPEGVSHALRQLEERGHAREVSHDLWAVTDEGLIQAKKNASQESE